MAIAGRSYANVPVIVRGSLEDPDDFNPKVPALVVTSRPAAVQLATPRIIIIRSTLADPPVLTTAPPVIVVAAPDRRWFSAGVATVISNPQAPAAAPATMTPAPVVVTTQPPWPKTSQAFTARNTLRDPPVLTTASPVVIAAAPDRRWYGGSVRVIANPEAPTPPVFTAAVADAGGAVDAIGVTSPGTDAAGAVDSITVTEAYGVAQADAGAAVDVLTVARTAPPLPTPALATLAAAPQVFIRSQIPRMYVQNLITGEWLHRDVQGITQPSVTWTLNAADSFSCVLSPPRPDMMSGGEPLLTEWRDAIYLEEDNEIKWGGILTSSTFQGPSWTLGATGFSGFASGMVYEGATYTATRVEAMDVVRKLWDWLQSQGGTNIGLNIPSFDSGYLLGNQLPSLPVSGSLVANAGRGQRIIFVSDGSVWSAGMVLQMRGDGGTYTVKSRSGGKLTLTTTLKGRDILYTRGNTVTQIVQPTPYQLAWWNSTDIGQEIEAIRQEAVFDWREQHAWSGSSKSAVRHTWVAAHPRIGARRSELRFCEGENIIAPGTVTRDGSQYAQRVIGTGYGQGSSTVRSTVTGPGGRLNRSYVYTDQTVTNRARMTVLARKVQASMNNIDAITSIVVKNHRNAPFGSFLVGDDIPVRLCTGWRNNLIWSRITSMTQDPGTDLMTLTLARSDSFNYIAESGQDGTA